MNVNFLTNPRRFVLMLATALLLAVMASSASIWLDELTGTALTPAAYACHHQGSGCG